MEDWVLTKKEDCLRLVPCSFPSGKTLTHCNRHRDLQTAVALLILETQRKAKEDEEKKAVASVEKKRTLALHEQHLEAEKVGIGSRENSALAVGAGSWSSITSCVRTQSLYTPHRDYHMLCKTSKRSWSKWLPGWTGWKSNCNPSLRGLGHFGDSFAMLTRFAVEFCRNSESSSDLMRCVHLGVDALACAAMAGSGAGYRASPNSLAEDGRPWDRGWMGPSTTPFTGPTATVSHIKESYLFFAVIL